MDDSLEDINKKLHKLHMVLILRSLHWDFDHVQDKILVGDQVPSMNSLVTRIFQMPTLLKDKSSIEVIETSIMLVPRVNGGHRNHEGHGGWSGRP